MLALIILVAEHLELIQKKENHIFLSVCFRDLKMNADLHKATSNRNNTKITYQPHHPYPLPLLPYSFAMA